MLSIETWETAVACIKVRKNGREHFIELPRSELLVLQILVAVTDAVIVPRIADLLEKQDLHFSDASLYSLTRRLEKRNLAISKEEIVPVIGTTSVRRVVWKKNFDNMEEIPVLQKLPE